MRMALTAAMGGNTSKNTPNFKNLQKSQLYITRPKLCPIMNLETLLDCASSHDSDLALKK